MTTIREPSELPSRLRAFLGTHGFKGRTRHFRRAVGRNWIVIGMQRSTSGPELTLNYGVWIRRIAVSMDERSDDPQRAEDCHWRERCGFSSRPGVVDLWWRLDGDLDKAWQDMRERLEFEIPQLVALSDDATLRDELLRNRSAGMMTEITGTFYLWVLVSALGPEQERTRLLPVVSNPEAFPPQFREALRRSLKSRSS